MSFLNKTFVLLSFYLLFYSVAQINASSSYYFRDDFNSPNLDDWITFDSQNEISVVDDGFSNKALMFSSPIDRELPFIQLNRDLSALNNVSIEFRYRMLDSGFGSGLILSDKQLLPYSSELQPDDYIFVIWPQNPSGFNIVSRPCPVNTTSCVHNSNFGIIDHTEDTGWHDFKLVYSNGYYSIYKDGNIIFESEQTELKVQYIYFGSKHRTIYPTQWPIHMLDYIQVSTLSEAPDESITILVPGLGTSWDVPAMLSGQDGSNWNIPSFVSIYDSLLKSLENSGYTKGEDLLIFPYDWRKSLDQLADDLDVFINDNTEPDQRVDIIGHSMGGLIGRIYAQKHGVDKVDHIITAGSPHRGVLEAYSVWEGASVWGDVWWEKVSLEIATEINKRPNETKVDAIRRQAPSIKDLLPVYDFLIFDGVLRPWSQLAQKNTFLSEMNLSSAEIDNSLSVLMGTGKQTKFTLNAKKRSKEDAAKGLWEDGKPIEGNPFVYGDGDGTVIAQSAVGDFTKTHNIDSYHVNLLADRQGIEKTFEILGIDKSNIEIVEGDRFKHKSSAFTVVLSSPGRLEVCDLSNACNGDLGLYFPENKMFILPGYQGDGLRVRVYEDGLGSYVLHLGDIQDSARWTSIAGELINDQQIDSYDIREGGVWPVTKDQCLGNGWRQYSSFKNQGNCISFTQRSPKALAGNKK